MGNLLGLKGLDLEDLAERMSFFKRKASIEFGRRIEKTKISNIRVYKIKYSKIKTKYKTENRAVKLCFKYIKFKLRSKIEY